MNKERELLFKIVSSWHDRSITSEEREQWVKDYAKEQIFLFLKFKDEYQLEEKKRHMKKQMEKGMYSWFPTSDETIYSLFIEQQNKE